jgi:hypothetical protein
LFEPGAAQIQQPRQPAGIERLALAVGQEPPQALHQRQGQTQLQRGDVSAQKGADEVLAPVEAVLVGCRQQALREPPAQPQLLPADGLRHLLEQQGGELHMGDAAGQAFMALAQQGSGRRAEQQKAAGPAIAVDLGAQQAEKLRQQLDFIETDQLLAMGFEKQLRLLQSGAISPVLQIEDHGIAPLGQQLPGQGGFAALARPQQQGRRCPCQGLCQRRARFPGKITMHFCSLIANLHGYLASLPWSLCPTPTRPGPHTPAYGLHTIGTSPCRGRRAPRSHPVPRAHRLRGPDRPRHPQTRPLPGQRTRHPAARLVAGLGRGRVRWALTYPEVYEVGASNLGHIILYSILNAVPGQLCDRSYLPAADLSARLRQQGLPLFAVESRRPLGAFDILGFSLSYELGATNILEMLDLAGIPLRAADRGDLPLADPAAPPLIFAGGPTATSNPEPFAAFFDFIALGDGEELLPEIGLVVAEARAAGLSRRDLLRDLAQVPGVYVPSLYGPGADGVSVVPLEPGLPARLLRRTATPMPHYAMGLVPHIETVHDRLTVEIRRGCTRGCRFCQPGMLTRPARDVEPEAVIEAVQEGMKRTGYADFSCCRSAAPTTWPCPPLASNCATAWRNTTSASPCPASGSTASMPILPTSWGAPVGPASPSPPKPAASACATSSTKASATPNCCKASARRCKPATARSSCIS